MQQKSKLNWLIITIELFSIFLLIILYLFSYFAQVPFENISASPLIKYKAPLYTGLLNKAGIIFWCGSVFISFFCYKMLSLVKESDKDLCRFFLYSFLFFGYFLLDELFQLHGRIIPQYIGIHQLIVLIIYAVVTIWFIFYFRKTIIKTEYIYFFIAVLFLGSSVIVDISSYLKILQIDFRYLLDDGFKYLGIVNLFLYFLKLGIDSLLPAKRY